jgi:hypothetical protein
MAAAATPTPMLADMRVGLAAAPLLCPVARDELALAALALLELVETPEKEATSVPVGLRCVVDGIAVPQVKAPLGQQPQKPSACKSHTSLPVQ